eukprot:TRINITY_DN2983_c0_g1_i1.p1 TRINITY_DN2983_c0_g1~~TRINITY_DN2983_c0_g1_i1.p1  ORF type:complete len:578 (-),score=87.98 TRINITY_DN2983_c0_g1_i1:399-2132(-)
MAGSIPLPDQEIFENTFLSYKSNASSSFTPFTRETPHRLSPELSITKLLRVSNKSRTPFLEKGVSIQDYEVVSMIGHGQFSAVFRCTTKEGECCAVKKSRRVFFGTKHKEQLLDEIYKYERVGKHQNILQYHLAWQQNGFLFIETEFCSKGSLAETIKIVRNKNKIWPEESIWLVLNDLSQGIKAIHSVGLVHLDIKPQNALVTEHGIIKVGDFVFFCKATHEKNCKIKQYFDQMLHTFFFEFCSLFQGLVHLDIKPQNALVTEHGIIKVGDFGSTLDDHTSRDGAEGDTRYMAPELLQWSQPMFSNDIYSLGLIIMEIAFDIDSNEFISKTDRELGIASFGLSREQLQQRSPRLRQLLSSMLELDPDRRCTVDDVILGVSQVELSNETDRQFIVENSVLIERSVPDDAMICSPIPLDLEHSETPASPLGPHPISSLTRPNKYKSSEDDSHLLGPLADISFTTSTHPPTEHISPDRKRPFPQHQHRNHVTFSNETSDSKSSSSIDPFSPLLSKTPAPTPARLNYSSQPNFSIQKQLPSSTRKNIFSKPEFGLCDIPSDSDGDLLSSDLDDTLEDMIC